MEENPQLSAVIPTEPPSPTQPPARPHRGGVILALGIIGIICCFICGIIAWVLGNNDLKEMDAGRMDPSGRGLTQAGKICGMVSVILLIVGLVMTLIWMIFMFIPIILSG